MILRAWLALLVVLALLVPTAAFAQPATAPLPAPTAAPAQPAPPVAPPPSVQPVQPGPAQPPPAAAPPATPPPPAPAPYVPPRLGKVLEVRGRDAIIDLGTQDGIQIGQVAEIFNVERVDLGLGESAPKEVGTVAGKVNLVATSRASVHLGLHEKVQPGWVVRFAERPVSFDRNYPQRPLGYFEIESVLRPYLGSGVGMLSEVGMSYHFEDVPIRLRARVDPIGATSGYVGGAPYATLGFDSRIIEVAVGGGVATKGLYDSGDAIPIVPIYIRVGAIDGVTGELTNQFGVYRREVGFGATRVGFQFPIGEGYWIILRMQASKAGGYGEIGFRFLVDGTGGPGSLFLTPLIGGATFLPEQFSTKDTAGFSLALGLEYRL